MKKCTVCGLEYDDDYAFCTECGGTLIEMANTAIQTEATSDIPGVAVPIPKKVLCSVCGTENDANSAMCYLCGAKLGETITEEVDDDSIELTGWIDAPIEEEETIECWFCKKENSADREICSLCGKKLSGEDTIEENTPVKLEQVIDENTIVEHEQLQCWSCGKVYNPTSDICKSCLLQPDNNEEPDADEPEDYEDKIEVANPIIIEDRPEIEEPLVFEDKPELKEPVVFEDKLEIEEPLVFEDKPEVEEPLVFEDKPEVEEPLVFEDKPEVEETAIFDNTPSVDQTVINEELNNLEKQIKELKEENQALKLILMDLQMEVKVIKDKVNTL